MSPTALVILDGFGYNPNPLGNAILTGRTPYLDWLWANFPHTLIKAAEEEVGLNFGQIGNSEVGHMAIGTGRVIPSPLQRINNAIDDRSFFSNTAFLGAVYHARTHSQRLHIVGMISSAGVHGDLRHMTTLLLLAKQQGLHDVFLHLILDGRDTGPREALIHLTELMTELKRIGIGQIASLCGRAVAMDRNRNWSKTEQYYDMLCGYSGTAALLSAKGIIEQCYAEGFDDETIPPRIINRDGSLRQGDAVILTNFREDRARQIATAISVPGFTEFHRKAFPSDLFVVTMTQYEKQLPVQVAFPPLAITNTLSDVLEANGVRQLHIAETEKYAHVTYFLNGGREAQLPHEMFLNIPSDQPEMFVSRPEMQAEPITTAVIRDMLQKQHDCYIVNYANADMIGHTGIFSATVLAVEALDRQIGRLAQQVLAADGLMFITADHGNAEQKLNLKSGQPTKDHTVNAVPFIMVGNRYRLRERQPFRITLGASATGILQDVAPTMLRYMNLPVPDEMTGTNLFSALLP